MTRIWWLAICVMGMAGCSRMHVAGVKDKPEFITFSTTGRSSSYHIYIAKPHSDDVENVLGMPVSSYPKAKPCKVYVEDHAEDSLCLYFPSHMHDPAITDQEPYDN